MESSQLSYLLNNRLRTAVQWCKEQTGMQEVFHAQRTTPMTRFAMEKCLTENFIQKHGLNYFGQRDLIYIDMRGDQDASNHTEWDNLGPDFEAQLKQEAKEKAAEEKAAKAAAKAAAGGDEDGEDGGDDEGGDDDE